MSFHILKEPLYAGKEKKITRQAVQTVSVVEKPPPPVLPNRTVRPISELPMRFRPVFPHVSFNHVQSLTFDALMKTKKNIVVSAPTGSGKTGVLELAMIKMLIDCQQDNNDLSEYKVVYLAPTKALCNERKEDWTQKFRYLNLECLELTSDNPSASMTNNMLRATILLATPEKWDSITRNFFNQRKTMKQVRLLLIDEVHLINDGRRGATLEAVISRMKALKAQDLFEDSMRFIAISANVSNVCDLREWFSSAEGDTEIFHVDPSERPVALKTYVLGYNSTSNDFAFDCLLSAKLPQIIKEYSNMKPTLIFCATRKSCLNTANYLAKEGRLDISYAHDKRRQYHQISIRAIDKNLQETTRFGIAFHHAGLQMSDRRLIEQGFLDGRVMILCSTSTLAMGVNLPAHLVIIKNTNYFADTKFMPYSESSLIQMIGRAGRPQFDTEATAVIMTKTASRDSIQNMLNGSLIIESQLHKYLTEHVNSEIVLGTIREEKAARKWIDSTYLRVRVMKCPENYGLEKGCSKELKDKALSIWVEDSVKKLLEHELAVRNRQQLLESTESGRAMAKHYLNLETMIKITRFRGDESLSEILEIIASTGEIVGDIQLRTEEKSAINSILNLHNGNSKLRFPITDKIDSKEKKGLVLIQAVLGNIPISDIMLNSESLRIIKNVERVVGCLRDIVLLSNDLGLKVVLNALILSQCMAAKLWENSIYVAKQLDKIGPVLSRNLAQNGLTSFESIRRANPRNIEIFCNRLPPFGSNVQQTCVGLPIYDLRIHFRAIESAGAKICVMVDVILTNGQDLRHIRTLGHSHECILLVGNKTDNRIIFKNYVSDSHLLTRSDLTQTFGLNVDKIVMPKELDIIEAHLLSTMYVGLNVSKEVGYIEPILEDSFE